MNKNIFFLLVIICVITHIIRTVYEILKHRKIIIAGKTSFVIVFINMLILWGSWFALCGLDVYKISLPDIVAFSGLILFCSGLISFLMGLITIKTLESYEGDLITKGIYSKIRHPMYLGFVLWLIAVPLFFGALFSFFLSFLFIGNVMYWRYLEEIELVERFPAYNAYKTTTYF
jgi:protein-S-isoprenylcysteine O-methyltransferase Ste14